jgi:hypothetical protein
VAINFSDDSFCVMGLIIQHYLYFFSSYPNLLSGYEKIIKQRLLCFNTSNIDWEIVYTRVFTRRLSFLQLKKISDEVGTYCYQNNIEDIETDQLLQTIHNYRNFEWDEIRRKNIDENMKTNISPLNI